MTLTTKIKTVVSIMLIAVVAAYAMHLNPDAFKMNTSGDSDNYVLSTTWAPVSMKYYVHIVVTVDGHRLISKHRNISPWGETMTAAKGAVIIVSAQTHQPTIQTLDCMIMRNGKSVPSTGFDKITGPGRVQCTA